MNWVTSTATAAVVFTMLASVLALTNLELLELIGGDGTDVSDDAHTISRSVIDLPGRPNDEVDLETLVEQLMKPFSMYNSLACIAVEHMQGVGIRLTIILNNQKLFKKEFSMRAVPKLCFNIPRIPFASACLEMYDINFITRQICFRLTGRLTILVKMFEIHLPLGCVKLPLRESTLTLLINLKKDPLEVETSANNENDLTHDDLPEYEYLNPEIGNDVASVLDDAKDLETYIVELTKFANSQNFQVCIEAEILSEKTLSIAFSFSGKQIYKKELSMQQLKTPLCLPVPGISVASICIGMYNIDLTSRRICFRLVAKINLLLKTFEFRIPVGCVSSSMSEEDIQRLLLKPKSFHLEVNPRNLTKREMTHEFFQILDILRKQN